MRVLVRPSGSPQLPIDVTNALVAAVARELARVQKADEDKTWLEAELLVESMVGRSMVGPCEPRRRSVWEERYAQAPERRGIAGDPRVFDAGASERASLTSDL